MTLVYQLTETELNEYKDTQALVASLTEKIESLQAKQLSNNIQDIIDGSKLPFIIVNNKLEFTSVLDFIYLYNSIARNQHTRRPATNITDQDTFDYLTNFCDIFFYENSFTDVSSLRQYRLKLQKDNVINIDKLTHTLSLV